MVNVVIDTETRSDIDLKLQGPYVYFASKHTRVNLFTGYVIENEEHFAWWYGETVPDRILELAHKMTFFAHNAEFDWLALQWLSKNAGWPSIQLEQMVCVATLARAARLPGALDAAARCLDLSSGKLKSGRSLMLRLARPKSYVDDTPIFIEPTEEERKQYLLYCTSDTYLAVLILSKLPSELNIDYVTRVWRTYLRMNMRGVCIDVEYAQAAVDRAQALKESSGHEISALTNSELTSVDQVIALKAWINRHTGLGLTGISETDLNAVDLDNVSATVEQVIKLRLNSRAAAVAKYNAALKGVLYDSAYIFSGASVPYGATTGRGTSRRLQVHNMRRDCLKGSELAAFRDDLVAGQIEPLHEELARNVRGVITHRPESILIHADWAQIEARVALVLTQHLDPSAQRLLDVLTQGKDIYRYQAAEMQSVAYDDVSDDQRFDGKVAQLSLTYQGGWRAVERRALASRGEGYGETRAREIVRKWRAANPWAVRAWTILRRAALEVVSSGESKNALRCTYAMTACGNYLRCILPMGRSIFYLHPKIEREDKFDELVVTFKNPARKPKQGETEWPRTTLFGGLQLENICQSITASMQMDALNASDRLEVPVIFSVHDDIVAEERKEIAESTAIILRKIMLRPVKGLLDLPLDVETKILDRFQ